MAKKKTTQADSLESVESALTKTELFIEENQKTIIRIVTVILALVVIFIGFKRFYLLPLEKEAQAQMFVAEQYFEADSLNLALYGDGNYLGFLDIIDEYGITKSANLSKYYAGVSYLKLGQHEEAIDYLKKFKSDDKMVAPIATGGIGDAYIEMGYLEQGLSYYMKAANQSENDFTAPLYLMKAAQIYERLEQYKKASEIYRQIKKEYVDFSNRNNIDKYITRSRMKADS